MKQDAIAVRPPEPPQDFDEAAEERYFASLQLRPGLPAHRAALVTLIEEGWRPWMTTVLRSLRSGARPGAKQNRTAMNAFQRACNEVGRMADAVSALFRRLGVESEEELERIVTTYRQAQRAEPEDNVESAVRVLEAHFKTSKGRSERGQIAARLGYRKENPDA